MKLCSEVKGNNLAGYRKFYSFLWKYQIVTICKETNLKVFHIKKFNKEEPWLFYFRGIAEEVFLSTNLFFERMISIFCRFRFDEKKKRPIEQ